MTSITLILIAIKEDLPPPFILVRIRSSYPLKKHQPSNLPYHSALPSISQMIVSYLIKTLIFQNRFTKSPNLLIVTLCVPSQTNIIIYADYQ